MRYVLLFSDGTINVGAKDEKSRYFVWGKKDWRSAVTELTALVRQRRQGKIVNLEIQSHGKPGQIVVPGGNVTNDNVAQFGGMLRAVMTTGGLIEVLACSVAGFNPRSTFAEGVIQYSPDVLEAYLGGMEKDRVAWKKDEATGKQYVVRIEGDKSQIATWKSEGEVRRTQLWGYQDNGLQFCLTLAQTSGAIVRASSLVQAEEYGDKWEVSGVTMKTTTTDHFIMRDYDRFGDWEGPVWDFMPNGSVKYLGCSIPRHKLRFPEHQNPQLTYNFREQGGNNTDVGQRPQRINRNPLPV